MMDIVTNENVAPTSDKGELNAFSLGTNLREARESLGLTIAEVSNRIKFASKQIEALEADAFPSLPEGAFLRGFVRSYARLLALDATPLLAALPSNNEPVAFQPAVSDNTMILKTFSMTEHSHNKNIYWLVAAVVLVVALVIIFSLNRSHQVPPQPVVASEIAPSASNNTVEQAIALPMTVESTNPTLPAAANSTTVPTVAESPTPPAVTVATPTSAQKTTPALMPETAKTNASTAATTASPLHLVFIEDTWVSIKDHSGKSLANQVSQRGSELWLNGQAPFSVSIKRPRGVHLFYLGKEVDLTAYNTTDVARLTLE